MSPSLVQHLERDPESPRSARHRARDVCHGRTAADLTADVELVVSELVTNAVLHGSGGITLRIAFEDGAVLIGVHDEGPGGPAVHHLATQQERGRGMTLVAALAQDWGVSISEVGPGKEVWCVVTGGPLPRPRAAADTAWWR